MAQEVKVTAFQSRVYDLLKQIPKGKVSTYGEISRALGSSPRAVGGALRMNPYAPTVPCHRVVQTNGYVGGFLGEWNKAPSGQNQQSKLALLKGEGVLFDEEGKLLDKDQLWAAFEVV